MAFAPLILRGSLAINDVDVSDQVVAFTFTGTRELLEVPATYGKRSSAAGGDDTYEIEIEYLQDTDPEALSQIFWDAITADPGTVKVGGNLRAGATSATNPRYTADAQVTEAGFGGTVNEFGRTTVTFRLLDRPEKVAA